MGAPIRVLHVEDDPMKARTIARGLTLAAKALGVELDFAHWDNLADAGLYAMAGGVDLILTDWCFPAADGEGEVEGMGDHVVAYAREFGIPCLVLSGSERPEDFRDGERLRWGGWARGTWQADLREFLALASKRP